MSPGHQHQLKAQAGAYTKPSRLFLAWSAFLAWAMKAFSASTCLSLQEQIQTSDLQTLDKIRPARYALMRGNMGASLCMLTGARPEGQQPRLGCTYCTVALNTVHHTPTCRGALH